MTATAITSSTASGGPAVPGSVAPRNRGSRPVVADTPSRPPSADATASTPMGTRMIGDGSCGSPSNRGDPKKVIVVARQM